MKKIFAVILTVALISMVPVTAFAAGELNTTTQNASKDVKGTYKAGATASTVYSVDVTWGSMEFTYTAASQGTWDPATHEYKDQTTGAWSCNTEGANKITVTNHSNAAVTVSFKYVSESSYSTINGSFSADASSTFSDTDNKLSLATAVDTATDSAPSGSVILNLSGELSGEANSVKIGAVTVTLNS